MNEAHLRPTSYSRLEGPTMDYATLAATTARLGFRPQDVAETVGMDARRFRRIRTGKYEVPAWLAEKVTSWAQEVDADADTALGLRLAEHKSTGRPVTLTRYPAKGFLARAEHGVKATSVETWDAYLALITLELDAAGVPYTFTTRSWA